MVEEEKDLVWLPKSLCKKIKEVEGVEALNREIVRYVEETKDSLKLDTEAMDEEIVKYRAYMIKARDVFKAAKNEELKAFEGLWEEYEKDLTKVRDYVNKANKELKPFLDDLKAVKAEVEKVNTWGIDKLGDAIQKMANLWGTEKEMMLFLMNNFKKKEE